MWRNSRGQQIIEYILLLAAVILVLLTVFNQQFKQKINQVLDIAILQQLDRETQKMQENVQP